MGGLKLNFSVQNSICNDLGCLFCQGHYGCPVAPAGPNLCGLGLLHILNTLALMVRAPEEI